MRDIHRYFTFWRHHGVWEIAIQQRLKQASDARAQEVAGSEVLYSGDANLTDEQIAKLPFALYPTQVSNSWSMVCHH